MFELGRFGELIIILVAALILIGPQELPRVMRTLGRWSQKLQHFKDNLSQNLDHHFYEGKFEEYQKNANQSVLESEIMFSKEDVNGDLNFSDELKTNSPTTHSQIGDSVTFKNNISKNSSISSDDKS